MRFPFHSSTDSRGQAISILLLAVLFIPASLLALLPDYAYSQVRNQEFAARRDALMEKIPDGLILVKARSSDKGMEPWGWIQNASFLYLTGLATQPGAILALDSATGESVLFSPPDPLSFGAPATGLSIRPGSDSADKLGLSSVRPWEEFGEFVRDRLTSGKLSLYIEKSRRAENIGVPASMAAVAGEFTLWEQSLKLAFPDAAVRSATDVLRALRWQKSAAEVKILRANALITAKALKSGARVIRPGSSQRNAEAAVVASCITAGGEGPSFWPWMMSGPNTNFSALIGSFFDYHSLNRVMRAGELVRADIGCAAGLYGADVGRTFPVSSRYSDEQREVWNLLVTGYLAGIDAMHDGAEFSVVRAASRDAIRAAVANAVDAEVSTEVDASGNGAADAAQVAKRAKIATAMLSEKGGVNWHIHGVGIESGEEAGERFVEGVVLAYEPGFSWNDESYYLEDMILIRRNDAEVLSARLPYFADEIESFMTGSGDASNESYPLFNGKNLDGWVNYGTEKWYVEDGDLVCESGPDEAYGYLGTDEVFTDFELTLEFRQISNGNSGVFFRSWVNGTTVEGWQVEVAPPGAHTGGIYESYGRGWLAQPDATGEQALREGDWNSMRVLAVGSHVTTWLNGQQMVDITDAKIGDARGRIALQIHDGGGIKVEWRNIVIRRL